jgi:hypothetical protein
MPQGKKETHESYGMLKFSRETRGKETALFGSSIPHREIIRLCIMPASVERDLNSDFFYGNEGRAYIEVEMTQAQFSESIVSMNQGSGIPVTIRRLNGQDVEKVDFINKRRQFENEFKNQMNELTQKIFSIATEAEEILKNKKSITKSDRQMILSSIHSLKQDIEANIPFISKQFSVQMDKTVHESKSEIDAAMNSSVYRLGLDKLEDLSKLLELNEGIKNQKQLEEK